MKSLYCLGGKLCETDFFSNIKAVFTNKSQCKSRYQFFVI